MCKQVVTLKDAACEQGMWVTAPAIKDVMVIPHHDLGDAGQGICQVPATPVLAVVREVEVCRLFGHCVCPVVRAETLRHQKAWVEHTCEHKGEVGVCRLFGHCLCPVIGAKDLVASTDLCEA